MNPDIAWTHPVAVAELPEEGAEFRLEADEIAREALAKFAGVIAVPKLSAVFQVKPVADGGASVEGMLEATVTQQCGVSLEPFDSNVTEAVSLRFAPEGEVEAVAGMPEDDLDFDPPDILQDGTLDLAAVAAEFLALGCDPYPRKPGVVFEAKEEGGKTSAFAILEQLKRGKGEEKA
jgi:uncharacterized metal-binding protein YceD (DUF177 family)